MYEVITYYALTWTIVNRFIGKIVFVIHRYLLFWEETFLWEYHKNFTGCHWIYGKPQVWHDFDTLRVE